MIKNILLFLIIIGLSGCVSNKDSFLYSNLDTEAFKLVDFKTPNDNFYNTQIICFNNFNDTNNYKESLNLTISKELGESIEYINEKTVDSGVNSNTDLIPDGLSMHPSSFGLIFNYQLKEDENGEYVGYLYFLKQELISIKKDNYSFIPVINTDFIEQDYYPTNKKPFKFFESSKKEEICYVITKW